MTGWGGVNLFPDPLLNELWPEFCLGLPGTPAPASIGLWMLENAEGVEADCVGDDALDSGDEERLSCMAEERTEDSLSLDGILDCECVCERVWT